MKFWGKFDQNKLQLEISNLEKDSSNENIWEDSQKAQLFFKNLKLKKDKFDLYDFLDKKSKELIELCEISIDLNDDSSVENISKELISLNKTFKQASLTLKLNGEFDTRNVIVGIKQGAGGVDSQDWAEMLFRMYKRWSEIRKFNLEIIDYSSGDEAGIKSVIFRIEGENAYGLLQSEKGAHRLVRISPFDTGNRRHTSFSLVEIMPELENEEEIKIESKDLRIDVFKAGGAGGQSVQKNSTAVRITHLPTNISVSVQNERSQLMNKDLAMKILQGRLKEIEIMENKKRDAEIKGEHISADFGSQIRSYIMHPYKMVKDHRTNFETSDIEKILDGNIDQFIEEYLLKNIKE
ncbi:MAG: peptide chain release factor 2 [Chloroflexota bacterium]|nr:peptide chain release factor 2 [Chloroflexota bacterium]